MNVKVLNGTYTFKGNNYQFDYYTNINLQKKVGFIKSVIETLFDENNIYLPVIRKLAFDCEIIERFTGINLNELFVENYGEDYKTIYGYMDVANEFFEETNIIGLIVSNMEDGLFAELNQAVDDNVAYRTGIHRDGLTDTLCSVVNLIKSKIESIDLENMNNVITKLAGLNDITINDIAEAYMTSDDRATNQHELIAAKNEEIQELKAKNNKLSARNVLSENKR